MSFLHLNYLFLSSFLVIPILYHLISRRNVRIIRFSNIEILKAASKITGRSIKLQRILLLITRILIIIFLSFLVARPYYIETLNKNEGSGNFVIIVDSSLSMAAKGENGDSLFKSAKEKIKKIISKAYKNDLIMIDLNGEFTEGNYSSNYNNIFNKIDNMKINYEKFSPEPEILKAIKILETKNGAKKILLITDLQKNSFSNFKPELPQNIQLEIIDIKSKKYIPWNITINNIKIMKDFPIAQSTIPVKSYIYNSSDKTREVFLKIKTLDGTISEEKKVSLLPKSINEEIINIKFKSEGIKKCIVEIVADDSLKEDNKRYFTINILSSIYALILRRKGENSGFYIKNSLNPLEKISLKNSLYIHTMDERFQNIPDNFMPYDILIVDSPPADNNKLEDRLIKFVKNGGSLLFLMDEIKSFKEFNKNYHNILPSPLISMEGKSGSTLSIFKITDYLTTHPLFHKYNQKNYTLKDFKFFKIINSDMKLLKKNYKVIASFSKDLPAIIEKKLGEGKILFFYMGFNRKNSNAPFSLQFVPFIQELAKYLGKKRNDINGKDIECGNCFKFHLQNSNMEYYNLVDLNGKKIPLRSFFKGKDFIISDKIEIPSIYTMISKDKSGINYLAFSANIPNRECRLEYLNGNDFKEKIKNYKMKNDNIFSRTIFVDISKYVIYLLIILLLLETILLYRMDRDIE